MEPNKSNFTEKANRFVTDTHMGKLEKLLWLACTAVVLCLFFGIFHIKMTVKRLWGVEAADDAMVWMLGFIFVWFFWGALRLGGFTISRPRQER